MNNEYSLIGNEDNHVVMDNRLIESKQMMPLNAAKIVRMAVARITYEDDKLRIYSCSITELADFLRVSKSNLYHDIRWMCDVLERTCVFVSTDNPQKPWERLQWIDYARYDGKGTLTMRLAKDVEPYLVSLRKCYTQYRLRNIIDFSSFYAIRLYEMLIHQVNLLDYTGSETFSYTISELRELLFCETKLLRFADFRRKVLNVAVREINEKSDIFIVMSFVKKGKEYHKVIFEIRKNKNPDNRNSPIYSIVNKRKPMLTDNITEKLPMLGD